MSSIYDISLQNIQEQDCNLRPYRGQVMLVVNLASRCGFTRQYKALETCYRDFKDHGVVVLGFPCDQFAHQEPGGNAEIEHFAKSCFRVSFPLFAKIDVKGINQSPLYRFLNQFIPWNFTKILIDRQGKVLGCYWPIVPMWWLRKRIQQLITQA
ncbi:MAG: glutathione peroxidase [Gammaproteobacteria bacterium]|nr:glutathione peroxidase [Gammaproteobacteria bacterium]